MIINPLTLHPELVFQTARSGGKGGQNVNKVETKVELRFDIPHSSALSDTEKAFLLEKLAVKLTNEGLLILTHQTDRSQLANKEKVLKKFNELIIKACKPIIKRRKTQVPASVKAIRKKDKKHHSEIKANRRVRFL